MLKLKVPPSTSGVFDRVKELNKSEYIYIGIDDPYKAWVTDIDENTITYSSAEYKGEDIIGKINEKQTLKKEDVNQNYKLGENADKKPLLIRKPLTAGGGKTRAPGKRVIDGRARVVYVGPRGGEYIKKDGKFVRI